MKKECTKCGETKPLSSFYRDERGRSGTYAQCKLCHNRGVDKKRLETGNPKRAYETISSSVAKIKLTQGQFAIVDVADLGLLNQYKWFASRYYSGFYALTWNGERRMSMRMHRLLLNAPDHLLVDHINGDTLDNRRENIRLVTSKENQRNMKRHRENPLSLGTYFKGGKWLAQTYLPGGGIKYIGTFTTQKEAHEAFTSFTANMI